MNTNEKFSNWVTSGVFNLTLTRNQIQALVAVYCGKRSMVNHSRGPSSLKELEQRGLVESLRGKIGDEGIRKLAESEGWIYCGEWLMAQPWARLEWLTPAGKLVFSLLVEAGLVEQGLVAAQEVYKPWLKKSAAWRDNYVNGLRTEA